MIVWISYNQPCCTLLAKYLPFKSMDGCSSLFGDVVPKGDVGGSELHLQRQLLFDARHCTVSQVGYIAGATRALSAVYQQQWLAVVMLNTMPKLRDDSSASSTQPDDNGTTSSWRDDSGTDLGATHSIGIAVHRRADTVYYVDVPPLPSGWQYARLVAMDALSTSIAGESHHNPNRQLSALISEDDSVIVPCSGDSIDGVMLLTDYAQSCQILLCIPSVVEHSAKIDKHADTDNGRSARAKVHTHNNDMLDSITTLVDQRYAQLPTP